MMKSLPIVLHRAFCCVVFFAFAWRTTNGFTTSKEKAFKPNHSAVPRAPRLSGSSLSSVVSPTGIDSDHDDDARPAAAAATISTTTTRREILNTATRTASAVSFFFVAFPASCNAAAPLDAGEAIRRGAANLPGYGSSDVFYPESFGGSWKATRDVQFPSAAAASDNASPPPTLRLTYPMRFIRSIEDDAVVADRGYNQAELEAAIVTQRGGSSTTTNSSESSTSPTPVVLSYDWVANNPNVVKVALADGTKKEIKVTKRATERTSNTVSSSEFQRITQEDTRQQAAGGPGAVPQISARRVVSKWKQVDESNLEGIEIVYAVGGGGDPLSAGLSGGQSNAAQSTILSKSRLYLVR